MIHDALPTRSPLDGLLSLGADLLVGSSSLKKEQIGALEKAIEHKGAKLKLFQHMVAARKAKVLLLLQRAEDALFSQLFDPEKIAHIRDPEVLIRIGCLLRDLTRDHEDYIEARANDAADPTVSWMLKKFALNQQSGPVVDVIKAMSPEKRELLRQVVSIVQHDRFTSQRDAVSNDGQTQEVGLDDVEESHQVALELAS